MKVSAGMTAKLRLKQSKEKEITNKVNAAFADVEEELKEEGDTLLIP